MDADQGLNGIDQRLQRIEERLSRLERAPVPAAVLEREHADVPLEPDRTEAAPLLALAGKSVLVLGGAFLLRAATESTAFPPQIGVVLGLLYAMAWIVAASLAARARRRQAAVFHSAVVAIVAYPVIWEATTHFRVLSAGAAALLLVGFSIALMMVAHFHALQLPAWIAAAGATVVALLLAYSTKDLIPFLLELTVVGVVAFILSMSHVGWLLAIESDLFALVLIVMTLLDQSKENNRPAVVTALMVFVLAWMAATSRASAQVAAASLIGIAAGSALVLSPSAMTILWGWAAVVAAEIARRVRSPAFALQSVAWGILAAIGGGLFVFAAAVLVEHDGTVAIPVPALIAAGLCGVAFLRLDFARVPLLAIATCALAAITLHAGVRAVDGGSGTHALVRTVVLAATAVTLAWIGRTWNTPEASQLATALLVMTGVKVAAQELRSGPAAIIFIALAVYGSAMLAMARLRRAPTIS